MTAPFLGVTLHPKMSLTAQQIAYAHIRTGILDGTYSGGMWLKPVEIAQGLQISRMPVREALRQLDVEGLVTLRANRGALVTQLTADDVDDLFAMRATLEALAGGLATQALTERALADLQTLCDAMDHVRGDVKLWMERHDAFHDYLCSLSGGRLMVEEIGRLRTALHPYLRMYIDVYRETELPGYEHQTLMTALQTRNRSVTEIVLRDHVLSAGRGVAEFLRLQKQQASGNGVGKAAA
jgi:DNA-binding GntR family transcriptional regulator